MTFEEIRTLLRAHFSELLSKRKTQIAETGRLSLLDVSMYETSAEFGREAARDGGSLVPGGSDTETVSRFIENYGLEIQPGTAAYANFCTELKRAYRDYCGAVLDYDRSLETYQFGRTETAQDHQTALVTKTRLSLRQLGTDLRRKTRLVINGC